MIENGVFLIDKPSGWTSFDVVNKIRFQVAKERGKKPRNIKVGHTGTLDPFATGLLVILIGKEYTRQAAKLSKLDKTYEAVIVLGKKSSTGDSDGDIKDVNKNQPSITDIKDVLNKFIGKISQTPPAFSAIKINGKRAYELARKGENVDIPARDVNIYSIELISYDYPSLKICTNVSSGTYIRSLAEDIGKELGTAAYCKELRRTKVGSFDIAKADGLLNKGVE
jgi:tRNA pseudouridine55 synthase